MAVAVPQFDKFIEPAFQAIKTLGGSGTVDEIDQRTFELMGLSEEAFGDEFISRVGF